MAGGSPDVKSLAAAIESRHLVDGRPEVCDSAPCCCAAADPCAPPGAQRQHPPTCAAGLFLPTSPVSFPHACRSSPAQDSPSSADLLMIARTASLELDDLVVDVDVGDLRSPGKSPGKSPVQARLEAWSPKTVSLAGAEELQRAAQKRKQVRDLPRSRSRAYRAARPRRSTADPEYATPQASLSVKAATLAKSHDRVRSVAEQQKDAALSAHTQLTRTAAQKQVEAQQKRTSILHETSANSGAHVDHAKAVAKEQAQIHAELLAQKKKSVEKKSAATTRRAALLAEQQAKAATDVLKAKARAQAKKEQLQSLRETADTKLAAHEYRREEAIESKLTKLEKQAEHAKHVRRKKGTVVTDEDAWFTEALKKAADKKPEQFDLLPERKLSSPPRKSAVQVRLEAQAAARSPTSPKDITDKLIKADERKQQLQADKVAALASHAEKVASVKESQKLKEEEKTAMHRASLDQSLQVASARKEQRLAAESEKAGADYVKAIQLSAKKKELMGSAKKLTQGKLNGKLENAARRRALFTEEQGNKLATQTDRMCEVQQRKADMPPPEAAPSSVVATPASAEEETSPEPRALESVDGPSDATKTKTVMTPVANPGSDEVWPDDMGAAAGDGEQEQEEPKPYYAMAMSAMGAGAVLAATLAMQMNLPTGE